MKLVAAIAAVFMAVATNANAEDLPVCPLEVAVRNLEDWVTQRKGERAALTLPILRAIDQINAKATNPNIPVGKQLSQADRDTFQDLTDRLLNLQLRGATESGYLRDARVIMEASKVALAISQGVSVEQADPRFYYFSLVASMKLAHPANDLKMTTPTKATDCDVDAGLHFSEQIAVKQINRLDFASASRRAVAFAEKYGFAIRNDDDWVSKIPSLPDRQIALGDMLIIRGSYSWREYINNLENLKASNRISLSIYNSNIDDFNNAHSQAELSARFGASWNEKVKQYDDWTKFLSSVHDSIEQKIPSDAIIEAQDRNNTLRAQGVIK